MPKMLFSTRPSKDVKRRMIVEACQRLVTIAPLKGYSYVGFGGLEFVDFDLFHRRLGITRMTSIEKDLEYPLRYEFNKPYKSIEVLSGRASEHLPGLSWDGLHVVWLDYTTVLTTEAVRDCETVLRNAEAGSVLILTVNASIPPGERVRTLANKLDPDWLPDDISEGKLAGEWGFAQAQWEIVTARLREVAALRSPPINLTQFLNFNYRDQARMQTIGWILSSAGLAQTIRRLDLESLEFVRSGSEPFEIKLPPLTRKELHRLNERLPLEPGEVLDEEWLDEESQQEYARLYRWYRSAVL